MSTNPILEKAIEYATFLGWYVFPTREVAGKPFFHKKKKEIVIPKVKSPYIGYGFKSSSNDVEQIKSWWARFPNAGIGVDCGKSKLVCIDIDVRDEKKGFDNFLKMGISDEGALHSITPSGGVHIIFRGEMKSNANVRAGVDIRGVGAYFVAPPSWIIENNKRCYYVATDDWLERIPASVPTSLIEKVRELRQEFYGSYNLSTPIVKKQISEPLAKTIEKARRALEQLPQHFCDDYFEWVNVGLALKTLGDDAVGFELWNNWSQKSSKYNYYDLVNKWESMKPTEISISSLIFWAKEAQKNEQKQNSI